MDGMQLLRHASELVSESGGRESLRELADVPVRVIGLISREVSRVDLAPGGVDRRARSQLGALKELHDARVRGAEAARQLERLAPARTAPRRGRGPGGGRRS